MNPCSKKNYDCVFCSKCQPDILKHKITYFLNPCFHPMILNDFSDAPGGTEAGDCGPGNKIFGTYKLAQPFAHGDMVLPFNVICQKKDSQAIKKNDDNSFDFLTVGRFEFLLYMEIETAITGGVIIVTHNGQLIANYFYKRLLSNESLTLEFGGFINVTSIPYNIKFENHTGSFFLSTTPLKPFNLQLLVH